MKAILLAGGLGTRMREETEFRPKPMVEVGGRPILWHIMKNLAAHGISEFIVATGYRSDYIKDYFWSYQARNNDFTVHLGKRDSLTLHGGHDEEWTVTVAYTGEATMTGGRVFRCAKYLDDEPFLVTYGDSLADIDLPALSAWHAGQGKLATVTTVQPISRFGLMEVDDDGQVLRFREKPQLKDWVNIGYFIFDRSVVDDYLDEDIVLEQEPLSRLAAAGELTAFRHRGFYQPMDTYRESRLLNDLWDSGKAPWRMW